MASLTIELPPQKTQTEYNLRRWSELLQCSETGVMSFYASGEDQLIPSSRLCPDFPRQVQL